MSSLNTFFSNLKEVDGDITKIKEKFTTSEYIVLNRLFTTNTFWVNINIMKIKLNL